MTKLTLQERVTAFQCFELPGQPMSTHMGTSYLINDLAKALVAMTADRDEYQLFADAMAAGHKIERDALLEAGKLALEALEQCGEADLDCSLEIAALKTAGVS